MALLGYVILIGGHTPFYSNSGSLKVGREGSCRIGMKFRNFSEFWLVISIKLVNNILISNSNNHTGEKRLISVDRLYKLYLVDDY